MNLDKLAKQLRRDVAANPKKAAALGLMVAVALYCWGPLVWGWLRSAQDKQSEQAQLAKLILTDDPVEAADKAKPRSKARFRWERVRPQIAQDPYMVSATFDSVWSDPFGLSAITTEGQSDSPIAPGTNSSASAASAVDPLELGLVLSSVAIGPKRRGATISGERYYLGDEIKIHGKEGKVLATHVRVAKITPQGVELEWQGKRFTLQLEQPRLANGDVIEHGQARKKP